MDIGAWQAIVHGVTKSETWLNNWTHINIFMTVTSISNHPVYFSTVTQSCPTLCVPMDCSTQASLSITNSQSLFKVMSIESVMPSNHLILCHPLFLPPSIFARIRVFSNESVLPIRWPKYWSISFSISPSNEYLGLISPSALDHGNKT